MILPKHLWLLLRVWTQRTWLLGSGARSLAKSETAGKISEPESRKTIAKRRVFSLALLAISTVGKASWQVKVETDCEFLEGRSLSFVCLAPAKRSAQRTVDTPWMLICLLSLCPTLGRFLPVSLICRLLSLHWTLIHLSLLWESGQDPLRIRLQGTFQKCHTKPVLVLFSWEEKLVKILLLEKKSKSNVAL